MTTGWNGLNRVSRRDAVVVALLIVTTAGVLSTGFLLNAHDFVLHVLAETAALLVGAGLVGVFVRLNQERQRRQTTSITLAAIWRQLVPMGVQAGIELRMIKPDEMMPTSGPRPSYSESLELLPSGAAVVVDELTKINDWMRTSQGWFELGDELPPGVSIRHKSSRELFGRIEAHYPYLRDHVAPRLTARSDDETLTRLLFDLETKHLNWQEFLRPFPDDLIHPGTATFTWRPAIAFYEVLVEIVAHIGPPLAALDPQSTNPEKVRELLAVLDAPFSSRFPEADLSESAPSNLDAIEDAPADAVVSRIGVIGDVHACDDRLARLLEFFADLDLDLVVCVGDIITGIGSPDRCASLLDGADVVTVRGNHDRWLLEGMPPVGEEGHRLDELAPETVAFLRELPASTLLYGAEGTELLVCHGLGENDVNQLCVYDYGYALEGNVDLQRLLARRRRLVVIKGHRHQPATWSIGPLSLIDAGTLLEDCPSCAAIIDLLAESVCPVAFIDGQPRAVPARMSRLFDPSR